MAIDNIIPRADPAAAHFKTASYASAPEPFFGDAEVIDIDVPYTLAADTDLAELTVVNYNPANGSVTKAVVSSGASNANAILGMPLKGLNGATGRVGIHTSGHWDSRALIWDATFTTQTLKDNAFLAGSRPMIRVSAGKFNNTAVDQAY